ncbi:MAG: hypothetical protein WBE37_13095, partial [Bryobacteraceae bacterium]
MRTLIPAISAASIQLIFFAIVFKKTSCSSFTQSIFEAAIVCIGSTPLGRHLRLGLDNSHANEKNARQKRSKRSKRSKPLTQTRKFYSIAPRRFSRVAGSHASLPGTRGAALGAIALKQ